MLRRSAGGTGKSGRQHLRLRGQGRPRSDPLPARVPRIARSHIQSDLVLLPDVHLQIHEDPDEVLEK